MRLPSLQLPTSLTPRHAAVGARTLYRGLRLVASAAPGAAGPYAALTLLGGLLPVAQAWLSKVVVDGLARDPSPAVLVPAALYVLALAAAGALQPAERALSVHVTDYAVAAVDRELIEAGRRLRDLHRVEQPAFGDELRLLDSSTHYLPRIWDGATYLAVAVVTVAGLLALLGRLHPLLPLVLAALAVPNLLVERRLQNEIYESMAGYSRAAREMDYCAHVTTQPDAAKEVRVFGLGGFFLRRFEAQRDSALREVDRMRLRRLGRSGAFVVLYAAALAGGFWYVASEAGAGRLTPGDVALYLTAVVQAEAMLGRIPAGFGLLHGARLHAGGFFSFLDTAGPAVRLPSPQAARPASPRLRRGLEFRHVSFAYPGDPGGEPVLRDVSCALAAGTVTALVGPNGAGKSTLVKLLTRMYDPTGGQILLDGRDLAEYDLGSLRSRIGVVYQDFARFSLSLRDNVAVGALGPARDDGGVERAARWAGADEVAASLPCGYETELTRRFEGGVDLSGGQWQKVALARGFLRDAALVILDEPASALDAEAESRLFEQFRELVRGRTALVISHRLSTVRMADHIVVLEGGRVLEQGSHEALMARRGRYADLFEMQAGRYR